MPCTTSWKSDARSNNSGREPELGEGVGCVILRSYERCSSWTLKQSSSLLSRALSSPFSLLPCLTPKGSCPPLLCCSTTYIVGLRREDWGWCVSSKFKKNTRHRRPCPTFLHTRKEDTTKIAPLMAPPHYHSRMSQRHRSSTSRSGLWRRRAFASRSIVVNSCLGPKPLTFRIECTPLNGRRLRYHFLITWGGSNSGVLFSAMLLALVWVC